MSSNVADFIAELRLTSFEEPKEVTRQQKRLAIIGIRKVVNRTPVDTGNLRNQWQLAVGIVPTGASAGGDPVSSGIAALTSLPDFETVYIVNNAEHAAVVELGGFKPKDPEDSPEANKKRARGRSKAKRRSIARSLGDAGRPLVAGGFSKQAPQGMLDVSFQELIRA